MDTDTTRSNLTYGALRTMAGDPPACTGGVVALDVDWLDRLIDMGCPGGDACWCQHTPLT